MDFEPRQPAIEERLLADDSGAVEWRVEAPAAEVSASLRGFAPVRGTGYAFDAKKASPRIPGIRT